MQSIHWIGFIVKTECGAVEIDRGERRKGMAVCDAVVSLPARSTLPAQSVLPTLLYLNFLQVLAPGGVANLRSGFRIVNACGIMDRWRAGAKQADSPAEASTEFRNEMCWWWRAVESSPLKRFRHFPSGSFVRCPRLPDVRVKALCLGRDSACAVYTDASGSSGWGVALGGRLHQGQDNAT